jgi:SAM-dependent MidA family methyltransferase
MAANAGAQADYANADQLQARYQQQGAYGQQANATNLQQQAAMGLAPSRAEILGRAQADQAAAAQASLAASARGPAALARAAPDRTEEIAAARDRLSAPGQMGRLFRVMALVPPGWPRPTGLP